MDSAVLFMLRVPLPQANAVQLPKQQQQKPLSVTRGDKVERRRIASINQAIVDALIGRKFRILTASWIIPAHESPRLV